MPVYNDWASATVVWRHLDEALSRLSNAEVRILCIDDGSNQKFDSKSDPHGFTFLRAVDILKLRRNLGHQRAIAAGLTYVYQHLVCDAIVCMDSDGEDRAEDVSALLEFFTSLGSQTSVFAARGRRFEGHLFQWGYAFFRVAHRVLLGFGVKIGNFSVLPFGHLSSLVVSKDLWSHYAATVVKLRLPMKTIPIDRGLRFSGHSKMSYASLINHGLSAISVFGELLAARLLIGGTMAVLVSALLCGILLVAHFKDRLLSFDWTTLLVIFLMQIAVGAFVITSAFAFGVLFRRDQLGFLPVRDAGYFVKEVLCVYQRSGIHV